MRRRDAVGGYFARQLILPLMSQRASQCRGLAAHDELAREPLTRSKCRSLRCSFDYIADGFLPLHIIKMICGLLSAIDDMIVTFSDISRESDISF